MKKIAAATAATVIAGLGGITLALPASATDSHPTQRVTANCFGLLVNLNGYSTKPGVPATKAVPAQPAVTHEEMTDPGQPYIAPTYQTVIDSPEIPAQPAVPAVTHTEWKWFKTTTDLSDWSATAPGPDWSKTDQSRVVVDQPFVAATPGQPEIGHTEWVWSKTTTVTSDYSATSPGDGYVQTEDSRVVVDSPEIPAVPAVPATYRTVIDVPAQPAVPAVTHVEHKWVQKRHPGNTQWSATQPGKGWVDSGETRTVVDVPAKDAVPAVTHQEVVTPEIPAQPEIPAVTHTEWIWSKTTTETSDYSAASPGDGYVQTADSRYVIDQPYIAPTPEVEERTHTEWVWFKTTTDVSDYSATAPGEDWAQTNDSRVVVDVPAKDATPEVPAVTHEEMTSPGQPYVPPTYKTVVDKQAVPAVPATPAVPADMRPNSVTVSIDGKAPVRTSFFGTSYGAMTFVPYANAGRPHTWKVVVDGWNGSIGDATLTGTLQHCRAVSAVPASPAAFGGSVAGAASVAAASAAPKGLAFTGVNPAPGLALAGGLLVSGVGLIGLRRRAQRG